MRKGFTLVELLAVMVVLAVLALIATPVVLDIIESVKESATLRSAEMYLSAVENSIMKQNMLTAGSFNPNLCTINSGNLNCSGTEVKVDVNGETPKDGSVLRFEKGKIVEVKFIYENNTVVQNSSGILEFLTKFCKLVEDVDSSNSITAGDKYECEVKNGTKYNFYVLTNPTNPTSEINLIMDRNICEDGKTATESNKCLVAWQSSRVAADGPTTAMDFLYNATSDWENVPSIIMNYDDRINYQEGYTEDKSYGKIITEGNITKITNYSDTSTIKAYENLKARIPYKSEVAESNGNNEYIYEYLDGSSWTGSGTQPTNNISGIYGYWTLSSHYDDMIHAWYIYSMGYINTGVSDFRINESNAIGIRPVITITTDNIIK